MPKMSRLVTVLFIVFFLSVPIAKGVEILSKSKLQRCENDSDSQSKDVKCENKIVLDIAVPSGSSGGEASLVARLVQVEENDTQTIRIRHPPIITIKKSAAYVIYELTYIRDVAYRPQEHYVETHKCESDADSNVVGDCERLRDEIGNVIEHTQPTCCPCGPERRVPTSCGNIFNQMAKGKRNTAHCLRFSDDWFHVFGIGKWSLGFNVSIEVKQGSSISRVVVSPENRTALSNDSFLHVNLIGDFAGYTSIPSFEDFYLVTPRLNANGGPPQDLGSDYSRWMLLERVRFTLDGLECDKIGVSYEAFSRQPDFCATSLGSCLHDQLFDFWEADHNRVVKNEPPQYVVAGRFERINQHPDAGPNSFSIGVPEALNTNLLLELSADDIEYVYQRSPGKILDIRIPTFEVLKQFGTANVTVKNTGNLEASYSLTFDCAQGVSPMEEQFFILKPNEVVNRMFDLHPNTDQAGKYNCSAILKASDFSEINRKECQFTTAATVLDNGTQIVVADERNNGIKGFFRNLWHGIVDFFTGKTCRKKCSSFFDFKCHIRYICLRWMILFALMMAALVVAIMIIWLLHQKGFFDPIYDCCRDIFGLYEYQNHKNKKNHHNRHHHHHHHHNHQTSVHQPSSHAHRRRKTDQSHHHVRHKNVELDLEAGDYYNHKHHNHHSWHEDSLGVNKEGIKHKHYRRHNERWIEPSLADEVLDERHMHLKN